MKKNEQYRSIEAMLQKERRQQRLGPISIALFFIAVMGLMYGVSAEDWLVAGVSGVVIAIAAVMAHFGHRSKSTAS